MNSHIVHPSRRKPRRALRVRSSFLAVGALIAAAFSLTHTYALQVIPSSPTQAVWFLAFGLALLVGGTWLRNRLVVFGSGLIMGVAGLVQLVLDGTSINPIPGGVGAGAVFLALGLGAITVGIVATDD